MAETDGAAPGTAVETHAPAQVSAGVAVISDDAVENPGFPPFRPRVSDIDPVKERNELAVRLGADAATDPAAAEEAVRLWSDGIGADAVLITADTTTNDPIELAGALARDRGAVVAVGAVGMNVPRRTYFGKELRFHVSRSYGPGRYDPAYEIEGRDYPIGYVRWTERRNLEAFLDQVAAGRVDVSGTTARRRALWCAVSKSRSPGTYSTRTGTA